MGKGGMGWRFWESRSASVRWCSLLPEEIVVHQSGRPNVVMYA